MLELHSRREVIKTLAAGALALPLLDCATSAPSSLAESKTSTQPMSAGAYPYELPALPYAVDALEPHVDARTMTIHHDAHHAAYVKGLNAALAKHPEIQTVPLGELLGDLERVPADIRDAVRNHGGGFVNHALFWTMMSPKGGGAPPAELLSAIERSFGTLDAFKAKYKASALGVFGSGWAWLTADATGTLRIEQFANQDTPAMRGLTPILGIDVWEHAYYLKHENRRADWVDAFWNVVDWDAGFAAYRRTA